MLTVKFLVIATNTEVEKTFDSYYDCKRFCEKVKRSKKLVLLYHPTFYER